MTQNSESPEKGAHPSYDDIVSAICQELDKINEKKIELDENTDMTKDLNIDSLAVMDLMFAIEECFDVFVPMNDLADIRTVKQLAQLVEKIASQE